MSIEFTRLVPIFHVDDLAAERAFYMQLGFTVNFEDEGLPDFIAFKHGTVEFGIERREGFDSTAPDKTLMLQFGIKDVDNAKAHLEAQQLAYSEREVIVSTGWKYRMLAVQSPNGYTVWLEGERE